MPSEGMLPEALIAQIYDTAINPSLWPQLLNQVTDLIPALEQRSAEQSLISIGAKISTASTTNLSNSLLLSSLSEHLERSAKISQQLGDNQQKQALQQQLFEQLPLPALVLSATGEVQQLNQLARHALAQTSCLKICDKRVVLHNKAVQRQFQKIIDQLNAPNAEASSLSMPLRESFQAQAISLNLSKIADMWQLEGSILLLIACAEVQVDIDLVSFSSAYQLTVAEQRLMGALIKERTLHEIAKLHQVSINTVRSQLKSIFKKTDCHRQSELIKLALTTGKRIEPGENIEPSLLQQQHLGAPCYHRQWQMTPKQVQGYSDIGRNSSLPLMMFHPSTGSRLQQHPSKNTLFEQDIRLITPDRPGFGLSSPTAKADLNLAAEDALRLADHLHLAKFSVAGFCGGGPFALALAALAPDRIISTCLISSVTPYQPIKLLHGVKTSNKLLAYIGLNAPQIMQPLLTFMARQVMSDPESYFNQVYPYLCESDAAALSEPEVTSSFLLAFREAMRQGPAAFANELNLLSQDWSLNFQAIQSPITLWHGSQDRHVPIQFTRLLCDALPQAKLLSLAPHGHLLIYHCWEKILLEIKQTVSECSLSATE